MTSKNVSMPLFPVGWTIVMVSLQACPRKLSDSSSWSKMRQPESWWGLKGQTTLHHCLNTSTGYQFSSELILRFYYWFLSLQMELALSTWKTYCSTTPLPGLSDPKKGSSWSHPLPEQNREKLLLAHMLLKFGTAYLSTQKLLQQQAVLKAG